MMMMMIMIMMIIIIKMVINNNNGNKQQKFRNYLYRYKNCLISNFLSKSPSRMLDDRNLKNTDVNFQF